jgi:hypothetical protein
MDVKKYIEEKYSTFVRRDRIVVAEFHRKELYTMFSYLGFKVGCEIGVLRGKNALEMFNCIPDLKLYLVDPYLDYTESQRNFGKVKFNSFLDSTMTRMKGRNYEFLKMKSTDACEYVPDESLEFIYIDGNHKYNYAMTDLFNWVPKVKTGGIISGHDFYNIPHKGSGVKAAVLNYTNFYKISPLYITSESRQKNTSWFFVKE